MRSWLSRAATTLGNRSAATPKVILRPTASAMITATGTWRVAEMGYLVLTTAMVPFPVLRYDMR